MWVISKAKKLQLREILKAHKALESAIVCTIRYHRISTLYVGSVDADPQEERIVRDQEDGKRFISLLRNCEIAGVPDE